MADGRGFGGSVAGTVEDVEAAEMGGATEVDVASSDDGTGGEDAASDVVGADGSEPVVDFVDEHPAAIAAATAPPAAARSERRRSRACSRPGRRGRSPVFVPFWRDGFAVMDSNTIR